MNIFVVLGKSLMWLWPFISEVFFEGKQFKQIIKENKLTFILFVLLCISLVFHYLSMSAIHRIINKGTQTTVVQNSKPKKPDENLEVVDKENQYVRDRLDDIFGKE